MDNDPEIAAPPALNLHREVAAAREVLDGLMALWRAQPAMTIDDARRLSALVFSGVRAVAALIYHQSRLGAAEPDMAWLDAALEEMEKEWG